MPSFPAGAARRLLRSTQLFGPLEEGELESLAARAVTRAFEAGQLLFSEGDACSGLFIVVSGTVRIFKISPAGREQVLAVEGPGSTVAELPVFDGGPYPASASAVTASELLFISRQDLRALCLEKPEVALKLLQMVGSRLRRLVGIIEELSFTTVRHRLVAWLLREAGPDAGRVPLTVSHQELAAHVGTVRELVSRNLARLQAEGLISIEGREIVILNREGLEEQVSSST